MADIVFVVLVIIGFFGLCTGFVRGCDRIVRSGDGPLGPIVSTPPPEASS
jgi:hypothetical protein